ncbi:MAG: nickel pincer cofactor biosynthesis protein LarC [bacterium]
MNILFADCFSGISGDMFLGALIDLGVERDWLCESLSSLGLPPFSLEVATVRKGAIQCTQCRVIDRGGPPVERGLREITGMIEASPLRPSIKEKAVRLFSVLGEAEATIHGIPVEKVHFHELGALDALVEIIGVLLGYDRLGIDALFVSPLPLGRGVISTRHGPIPVPSPATVALLKDVPVIHTGLDAELVTPTGALLATQLAKGFGMPPQMKIQRVGYGAGERDLPERPNCLRLILGETDGEYEEETIEVLECDIDDMNPEFYPHLTERLFNAAALDVTLCQIIMKKGRPGTRVTVLSRIHTTTQLVAILLAESSTLGVRIHRVSRSKASRRIVKIQTAYGPVRVKCAWRDTTLLTISPEYEDYSEISRKYNRPVKSIYQEIMSEALKQVKNLVDQREI